ncbi:hypothetical protein [Arenibacterium halophilum]|uniref:Uncharacterized protein n=1 Tax=Arenibacterium halophilum TaxID=2583821 RepID=A0ABY2X7Z1_9RHOB|nr:hypothetical protein [Arenibacterium halophilum]TMV11916.1 hypothetical protein FGK64_16825 [Arenibacterium halophilum]
MKRPKTYTIKIDVENGGKAINTIQVTLTRHIERNIDTVFNIDLVDDPLYPALHTYVMNNPPRN